MIKVTYYYSACVAITTPDVSILCDPWFTDGIYDGSWYQYPKIKNPIELIGKHDIIYVSHIHPDHYDPKFLREYLEFYPNAKIYTHEFILKRKLLADGFKDFLLSQCEWLIKGSTKALIIKNDTGSISDIDTALVVKYKDHAVVNMNDNAYYQPQIDAIKEFAPKIDIALLGHTGAGPYPQTYYKDIDILEEKAEAKKQEFFDRYKKMAGALDAKINIPFAGQYILGGKLSHLNKYRGVSDAVEMLPLDPNALVLEQGASVDTKTFVPTAERVKLFDEQHMTAYASSIVEPMDYMRDFKYLPPDKIQWGRLLGKAAKNAMEKSEFNGKYCIYIKFVDKCYEINLETKEAGFIPKDKIGGRAYRLPYSIIEIDYRYLFGLLTGIYHWNNAEVGSQYMTTRAPDMFNREVQRFLNFFVV